MKKRFLKVAAVAMACFLALTASVYAESEISIYDGLGTVENGLLPSTQPTLQGDVVALDDLGISIVVNNYTTIRQDEGFVYVYTKTDSYIPYIIIGRFDTVDPSFVPGYDDYMAEGYSDLRVAEADTPISIAGKQFTRVRYEYTISGYTANDTRLFSELNGATYMFASKEVPYANSSNPEGLLESIASSFSMLAGGADDYEFHVDSTHWVEGNSAPTVTGNGGIGNDILEGRDDTSGTESGGGDMDPPTTSTTEGPTELPGYIRFDESKAEYQGSWVHFNDAFKLYLPETWTQMNISPEQQSQGLLYAAYDPNAADNRYVEVDYMDGSGYSSLDQVVEDLTNLGLEVEGKLLINGIEAVSYGSSSQDKYALMFFHPQTNQYLMSVIVGPYANNVDTLTTILVSLTPGA